MALNHITNSSGTIMNRYTLTHADNTIEDVRLAFKPSDDYVAGSPFNENTMNPIIDAINNIEPYPVGSIYMSINSTNPSTLFGGTWEQLKDRFLLGAGDTYTAGATGGEATHTLTINEIPSHTHGLAQTAEGSVAGIGIGYPGFPNMASTQATGGGQSHNNMPPYLVVFMWKRVS